MNVSKYGKTFEKDDELTYDFAYMDWLKLVTYIDCLYNEDCITITTRDVLFELLGKFKPEIKD